MKGLKPTLISLLAIGLLAGSAVGVAAQDPAQPPGAETSAAPSSQVSGRVYTGDLERPTVEVRIIVTLVNATKPDEGPLGEWVSNRTDLDTFPFAIEYAPDQIDEDALYVLDTRVVESDSGRVLAVGMTLAPVITRGYRTEDVAITLALPEDAGSDPQVAGVVMAGADLPDLDGPAKLVVALVDAAASDDGVSPLGEFVEESLTKLRPPRTFSIEYAAEAIVDGGEFVLESRLEDVATGNVLAIGDAAIPVITDGNPVEGITIKLVSPGSGAE